MKPEMSTKKCLLCYQPLQSETDFHESCSMKFFGSRIPPKMDYSLHQMDELAKNIIERSVAVPGVQAKLSLSLLKESTGNLENRLTVVGALGGNFIFKPPSSYFIEMPENEHLTMLMAASFGIRVVPASLIRLASGELAYITKRVDRSPKGEKIHMLDMFQITEAFDKYKSSVEKIGKAIESYSDQALLDKIFFFELVVFSFLTGNNDMHLKNFSMIKSNIGWTLAPAYDLLNVNIINPEDSEEMALTLCGKKRKLKREHFDALAKNLGLTQNQTNSVYKRIQKNKPRAIELINVSFLSDEMKTAYHDLLELRYSQMEL
jgi:serine/threonine-protein kinase HipA